MKIYFTTNRDPNQPDAPTDFATRFSASGLTDLRFGGAEVTGAKFDKYVLDVAPEKLDVGPEGAGALRPAQAVLWRPADDLAGVHLAVGRLDAAVQGLCQRPRRCPRLRRGAGPRPAEAGQLPQRHPARGQFNSHLRNRTHVRTGCGAAKRPLYRRTSCGE